jgi:hypothetical protein
LNALVGRFRDRSLPRREWTHEAHLAVGAWHVHHLGPERALDALREGIRRLNDAHGTPNTDYGGYHETITRAYIAWLAVLLADRDPAAPLADAVHAVLSGPVAARDALLSFYSKAHLMSVDARRGWVEPDLRPLPSIGARRMSAR